MRFLPLFSISELFITIQNHIIYSEWNLSSFFRGTRARTWMTKACARCEAKLTSELSFLRRTHEWRRRSPVELTLCSSWGIRDHLRFDSAL